MCLARRGKTRERNCTGERAIGSLLDALRRVFPVLGPTPAGDELSRTVCPEPQDRGIHYARTKLRVIPRQYKENQLVLTDAESIRMPAKSHVWPILWSRAHLLSNQSAPGKGCGVPVLAAMLCESCRRNKRSGGVPRHPQLRCRPGNTLIKP